MLLYRYMSLDNPWFLLDLVVSSRIHCATWDQLNDPLEGSYELYAQGLSVDSQTALANALEANRNRWRIASFSQTSTNILLWSHYAAGHKGVAVEVNIPDDEPLLHKIFYSGFNYIFTEDTDLEMSYPTIFAGKTDEWAYEEEWRIISEEQFVALENPCTKILLGPLVSDSRKEQLRRVLPSTIQLVSTVIDRNTFRVVPSEP